MNRTESNMNEQNECIDESIVLLAYGDDWIKLFNGGAFVTFDYEEGERLGRIRDVTGNIIYDTGLSEVVPLINSDSTIGYLLVDDELATKMYTTFFEQSAPSGRARRLSSTPMYTTVQILTPDFKVDIARALISPYMQSHPSMVITYKQKKYNATFKNEGYALEYLRSI